MSKYATRSGKGMPNTRLNMARPHGAETRAADVSG